MLKEIKVNGCGVCPFRATEYDDFSVGYDSMDSCLLAQHYNQEDTIIDVYDMGDYDGTDTPKWCPLLGNKITISYG